MKVIINVGWLFINIRKVRPGEEEKIDRLIEKANNRFKKDQHRKVRNIK